MNEYSIEKRIAQLFKYFKDVVPSETVARNYCWESYNHQSEADARRDAIAMKEARELATWEYSNSIFRIGDDGVRCTKCGNEGYFEEWTLESSSRIQCPKCENRDYHYAILYKEKK